IFASWKGGSLDADGDHVGDSIDNCPTIPNHTQANADGDVRGDACDCAPADPGSFAVPDEIEGVSFLTEGETLIWTSLASSSGSATSYEVYRELEDGGPAGSSPGGSCANPPPAGTVFVDSEVPPKGTAWRYLVRGRNACGAGTWGS